jgi:hypothetical protein
MIFFELLVVLKQNRGKAGVIGFVKSNQTDKGFMYDISNSCYTGFLEYA